jgi:hypothetical protein
LNAFSSSKQLACHTLTLLNVGNLCNSYVTNAPSCANSSWTLWDGGNNPFCCLGDQIGVNPNAVSFAVGACVANNVVLPASKSATSVFLPVLGRSMNTGN